MKAQGATLVGSVVGSVLASACCIGPLVFALLGVSGAAFGQRFEPFRPYFLVVTYGLLAAAFYLTYRPAQAKCVPSAACQMPRTNGAGKVVLWIASVLVVLTTAFPLYSVYLF